MVHNQYTYDANENVTEEMLIERAKEQMLEEENIEGVVHRVWHENDKIHIILKG